MKRQAVLEPEKSIKPAVLFWFYKDIPLCVERLTRFRRLNPELEIYALYGGEPSKAGQAEKGISNLVDDFYCFNTPKNPEWKWENGDHLIAHWYLERGTNLKWNNIFILQWDMLILEKPLQLMLEGVKQNQIILSGFTKFENVEKWWGWAKKTEQVKHFKEYLQENFAYEGPLYACLFIVACFPRKFLAKYSSECLTEIGFLEYKIPTLASIFGFEIFQSKQFEPWWAANPKTTTISRQQKVLNASGTSLKTRDILRELVKPNGRRIFHPYEKSFPIVFERTWLIRPLTFLAAIFRTIKNKQS